VPRPFFIRGFLGTKFKEVRHVWVVVYVTPSSTVVEHILDELSKSGILARSRPIRRKHGEIRHYEILVPEAELDEACQLLGSALMGR
jgi:hypothetical protein